METISMEVGSKKIARQNAFANKGRITININGVDQYIDYRDVLTHLLFRIIDDVDWDRNPLSHLREYFPDFHWKFYAGVFSRRWFPHIVPNTHFVFVFESGFITAVKTATVGDTCCVVSKSTFELPKPPEDRVVVTDPMLGEVTISSYNRR